MPIVPEVSVRTAVALPSGQAQSLRQDAVAMAVAASLLLHALVLAAAAVWRSPPADMPEINIPVELLSAEQYEAETRGGDMASERVPPAASAREPPPAANNGNGEAGGMIEPTRMLSAAALADPRSRQAREMLPQFDPTERTIQLCDIEAMEQVHAWQPAFVPERLVAYATADVVVAGDVIRADGAAFFSGGKWYRMRFDCGLSADHGTVVSFAFLVGEPIPRAAWEAHSLPSGEELD